MTGGRSGRRDLAGWLAAAAVAAALFGGAAAAALRSGHGAAGAVEAVALDLSVGVVPMSAVLPSVPPAVEMAAPELTRAPQSEAAPDLPVEEHEPIAQPRLDLPPPVMDLPQADAPPMIAAARPPVPDAPALDMAQSPRPVARPDRARGDRARISAQQAEEAQPAAPQPEAEAERAQSAAAPAQLAGSDQAARPAQERRPAAGQAAATYGDQVMRQIAKLRRRKAPDRGVVTVGFEIGGDGGLLRVAVVSSSGSAALDQVAVDHIRRAAPFPPPPEGATTRFGFEFVGK